MFSEATYVRRRAALRERVGSGLILFVGHEDSPMNYTANTYHFRQDSSFLYFFGLDSPGLAAVIDADDGREIIFGNDIDIEDIIWMGDMPALEKRARRVGVQQTAGRAAFAAEVGKAVAAGRRAHFLPPYRPEISVEIGVLIGVPPAEVKAKASVELVAAVVAQRLIKSAPELAEIENALGVTAEMYRAAMSLCRPGRHEREIAGAMEGIALSLGCRQAFPPIVTINGQILHSHGAVNELRKGRLLVVDAGAESWLHYASDITRTVPVGGKFSRRQRDIYEIVFAGQAAAIEAIKPGVMYKEVHLKTARIMAEGLKDLGLMRGDLDAAVAAGAHALFFVHGLGHNLGLDVHDMESLGENHVGYDDTVTRSGQFGLAYLRMAKALRPGHVLTVEPGIYFIPALFDQWRKERKFTEFIAYDKVEGFLDFGGVRIEDDVVVTAKGNRVLGPPIPKTVAAVEKACAR